MTISPLVVAVTLPDTSVFFIATAALALIVKLPVILLSAVPFSRLTPPFVAVKLVVPDVSPFATIVVPALATKLIAVESLILIEVPDVAFVAPSIAPLIDIAPLLDLKTFAPPKVEFEIDMSAVEFKVFAPFKIEPAEIVSFPPFAVAVVPPFTVVPAIPIVVFALALDIEPRVELLIDIPSTVEIKSALPFTVDCEIEMPLAVPFKLSMVEEIPAALFVTVRVPLSAFAVVAPSVEPLINMLPEVALKLFTPPKLESVIVKLPPADERVFTPPFRFEPAEIVRFPPFAVAVIPTHSVRPMSNDLILCIGFR